MAALYVPGVIKAQTIVKATVVDSASGSAVPFANVIIKGTLDGTITNENGYFELDVKESKPVLVISSLGYFTKEIRAADITNGKIFVRSKATQIDEVVIEGKRVKVFQEKNNYYYMDFHFYDDNLVALVILGNKRFLQLLDPAGKIITQLKVDNKSQSIFYDCIGNLHLLTSDSSYQIYYDYVKLRLLSPFSLAKFNSLLAPCLCSYKNVYYFRQFKYRGLKCDYYCIRESEPGKAYPFKVVADSTKIKDFNTEYDLHYFLEVRRKTRGEMYGEPISTLKKNLDKHREELPMDWAGSKWLHPVEASLHRIGDGLYLFNFTDSLIEKYHDYDSLIATSSFRIHRDKSCIHNVIVDETQASAYIPLEKNGITTLGKINLESGEKERAFDLKGYPFISKVKIRNGIAYFLYVDKGMYSPAKIHRFVLD